MRAIIEMGNSLAFMEKSLSNIINTALISMDKLRLKYPGTAHHYHSLAYSHSHIMTIGMPIGRSSLLYLALYLKAHRPSNEAHVTDKYLVKLAQYQHDCQLIPQLSQMHSYVTAPLYHSLALSLHSNCFGH
jgi:hypothetical protein